MALFRNKYRIESSRLPDWDYSSPGYYFVTVCAFSHECIFGEISNNEMHWNANGEIVQGEWEKSFELRRELKLDVFCIMPNHFHAIVRIMDAVSFGDRRDARHASQSAPGLTRQCVSPENANHGVASRTPKSISTLMGGFKSSVTRKINDQRKTKDIPIWQPRFHDHVIRNERELFAIGQYIKFNPTNWDSDRDVIETKIGSQGKQPWFVYLP
jgi:putative transposase